MGEHRALYDGSYKYMVNGRDKVPELYDLHQDPQELNNLTETLPDVALGMAQKLSNWRKQQVLKTTTPDDAPNPLSKNELEGLKALGYIQ